MSSTIRWKTKPSFFDQFESHLLREIGGGLFRSDDSLYVLQVEEEIVSEIAKTSNCMHLIHIRLGTAEHNLRIRLDNTLPSTAN